MLEHKNRRRRRQSYSYRRYVGLSKATDEHSYYTTTNLPVPQIISLLETVLFQSYYYSHYHPSHCHH